MEMVLKEICGHSIIGYQFMKASRQPQSELNLTSRNLNQKYLKFLNYEEKKVEDQ